MEHHRLYAVGVKKLTVSLCSAVFTWMPFASAAAVAPSFADTKWLSTRDDVRKQMQLKGYTYSEDVERSNNSVDNVYKGKLLNYNVEVMHMFNKSNKLVRTMVIFTASSNLYKLYGEFKTSLENKYKEGVYMDKVDSNYRLYDSLFQSELKNGKELFSTWIFDGGYVIEETFRQVYVNNPNQQLTISYYSPEWDAEAEDRSKQNDL